MMSRVTMSSQHYLIANKLDKLTQLKEPILLTLLLNIIKTTYLAIYVASLSCSIRNSELIIFQMFPLNISSSVDKIKCLCYCPKSISLTSELCLTIQTYVTQIKGGGQKRSGYVQSYVVHWYVPTC